MREISSPDELRSAIASARRRGEVVGFVPTMGYLHAGHLRLVERARQESGLVALSIYVNPTQFGPNEDFASYPRDIDRDRHLAAEAGVDILFLPEASTMYPDGMDGQMVWVDPGALAQTLCGASRPGHFRGVATVVTKLFHLVEPDRAYFGQKDGQQAIIISQLVRQLSFPIDVRILPTVREEDGLALSSRNVYLSSAERSQAPILSQSLASARQALAAGERDHRRIEGVLRSVIAEASLARLDYASVVDLHSLQPLQEGITRDALVAVAVYFGRTRLIDNTVAYLRDGAVTFM